MLYTVKVAAKVLEAFTPTITSVDSLITFIERLESDCCTCIGNPDTKFKPLIQEKKGVFSNAKGTYIVVFLVLKY